MEVNTICSGVLTIGVDASAPGPFHSGVPGTPLFRGFDVDLATEVARRMGLAPRFVECFWRSIFASLQDHRFDIVCTACTITKERLKIVDFSEPYFESELVLITRGMSHIRQLEDAEVRKIAVRVATVAEDTVRVRASGKQILTFDFNEDAYNALASGEVDAVVDDALIAPHFLPERPIIRLAGPVPGTKLQYGMMLAKGNDRLRFQVSQALSAIKADGSYDRINSKWFGKKR